MTARDPDRNLLDELAADAPIERMRSRFDTLLAAPPQEGRRSMPWLASAAAVLLLLGGLLVARLQAPSRGASGARVQAVLEMLEAPSPFDRLRGANAAADLERPPTPLVAALLDRLETDDSVNVRLAALDALLAPDSPAVDPDRLTASLVSQRTAIVQAHLGFQLRRRNLLSRGELDRLLERPEIQTDARNTLIRMEES